MHENISASTASGENALNAPDEAIDFLPKSNSRKAGSYPISAWDIGIHTDYTELEPVWRRMEAQGYCTVFQTYDWVSCWYETALSGGQATPLIVTVSGKSAGIVWILPLCLYVKRGVKVISFADLGVSDYIAPIISQDAPEDT
jgi:CelD/BcsL family acetyltransferase involved in cellulose biosynthesis